MENKSEPVTEYICEGCGAIYQVPFETQLLGKSTNLSIWCNDEECRGKLHKCT